jgi:hypothetical protein
VDVSNNFQCYQASKNVETLQIIFLSDILIVDEKNKIFFLPTYP